MEMFPTQIKFKQLKDVQTKLPNVNEQNEVMNSNRIINLVNKTRSKLKLINITPDARFNKQLQEFRLLETFIDTKARLKRMNILNNRDLLESVKGYLIRRKIARQLGHEDMVIEKIDQLFEVKFDSEFDKTFLESDYFLNFGEEKVKPTKPKLIKTERWKEYKSQKIKNIAPLNLQSIKPKPRNDQNLFYQQIDDRLEIQQREKEESQNFFNLLGKQPTSQPSMSCPRKQEAKEKLSQIDYDKELIRLALSYGIDLNSTAQLEEDIYKAFKFRAHEYIKKEINAAKQKLSQNVEQDNQKNKQVANKLKKRRVSSMFEQQLLNYPKIDQYRKSIYEIDSNTLTSENQKSIAVQERLQRKREKTIMISNFNQQSKQIANVCEINSSKMEYYEFMKDLKVMKSYVDELTQRTNFQFKLSELGFSKQEEFLKKKQIVLPGKLKRNSDFNVNIQL